METKLYLELYNYVDEANELIQKLSAENKELLDICGVFDAMSAVFEHVAREGMSRLEEKEITGKL